GRLGAAERQVHFRSDRRRVDVGDSGVQVADGCERSVYVFRVERRRQAILDVVGNFDRVFETVARNDGNDRAEDFLLSNAHFGIDVGKDGWLHEPAVAVLAPVETVATANQLRALVLANFDVAEIGLKLFLVDRGTHLHSFVEAVSDFQFSGSINKTFDKVSVNAFLHDDATGRGATLTGRAEGAPQSAFDGKVEIGVIEDDHGVLAPQFKRAMFETFRG